MARNTKIKDLDGSIIYFQIIRYKPEHGGGQETLGPYLNRPKVRKYLSNNCEVIIEQYKLVKF